MPGRIDGLPAPEAPRRPQQTDTGRSQTDARTDTKVDAADRIELSESARQALAQQSRLNDAARSVPDVREDRVTQARARLEAGEYDTEEVRQTIADRLLDQFGV